MKDDKRIIISEELDNLTQPWIEYLVENYTNPNKFNSCLDVASDNIRMLESLINQAQSRLKDFIKTKKRTISSVEKAVDVSTATLHLWMNKK